jgi:hypothetical protein
MSFWNLFFFLIFGTAAFFIVKKILNKYDEPPNFKEEIRLKKLEDSRRLKQFEEHIRLKQATNISNVQTSNNNFYSQQSPINSFWHGQKGLSLTFWGYFVGGNILFNAVALIFADNQTLIIVNLIFFIIWNVLSVMGVFNAADIYKAEKMKQGLPYTPATAAKISVVLLILSGIGNSIPK